MNKPWQTIEDIVSWAIFPALLVGAGICFVIAFLIGCIVLPAIRLCKDHIWSRLIWELSVAEMEEEDY